MKKPKGKPTKRTISDTKEKVVYWCDRIIEAGLILIVFFVPLIFTISTGADIFNLPRLTFLRVMTIPVALAWVIRLFETREFYRLKSPMTLPVLAVLLSWLLSSIFSLRPEVSFLGNYLRHEGFWTIANMILLFFIASSTYKTTAQVNRLLQVMLWSGLVTVIYGTLQFFGLDWISWASKGRPFSTLGNPDFFPHFLIMLLPIALMKFLHAPKLELKLYLLAFIALLVFNVVVAQTRGSYVGLAISLPVLLFFISKKAYRENRNWLIAFGAAFVLVLVYLVWKTDLIASILRVATVKSRFYIWLGGISIFFAYPFLGVGPDVLRIASPPFKDLRYSLIEPMNNPDRMHNQYLDELIMRGAIGFLVYMWMLVSFFVTSFKTWKSSLDSYWKAMIAGIAVGVLAYLGQNIVAFGVIPTILYFWMLMALNTALSQMDLSPAKVKTGKKEISTAGDIPVYEARPPTRKLLPEFHAPVKIIVYLVSSAILITSGYWAIRFMSADLAYGKGETAVRTAQYYEEQAQKETDSDRKNKIVQEANRLLEEALNNYARAVALNPWEAGYRTATEGHTSGLGNLYYDLSKRISDPTLKEKYRSMAREEWTEALKTTMYLENVYMMIGRSYQDEANEKPDQRQELLRKAAENFEKGIQADPGDYPLYFQLASIYTELGDPEKAVERAEKGIIYAQPTENRNYSLLLGAQTNFNLGSKLKQEGKTDEGAKYLNRSKELAEQLLTYDPGNSDAKELLEKLKSLL
ncbi:MAG: O-antigen ligase family protein [Caldiserica bacterium]|nr:O-antigen ligase family protein [Caldisericota bacterium]MDH7562172.1 O-antigen ligase family protein [Caldisericota bacterium]